MPRYQQVVRQWRLLRQLERQPSGVSIAELAGGDQTRQRAIYRDIEALQQAGFPLYQEDGDGGRRWRLIEGARMPRALPLMASEVLALRCARSALDALEGTPYHEALGSLTDKLDACLAPELRRFAADMDEAFVGDRFGHADYGEHADVLEALSEARARRVSVNLRYRGQRGETERRVNPYNIWLHRNVPYLVAWCRLRDAIRTFTVSRIVSATVTDEAFEPRPGYDFNSFVGERFRIWGEDTPAEVAIWFAPEAALYVQERTWHPTQEIERTEGGAVVLRMRTAGLREIASWVLGFGPRARALGPEALVASVRDQLRGAQARYEDETERRAKKAAVD